MAESNKDIQSLIDSLLETFEKVASNIHLLGKCSKNDFNYFSEYFKECHADIHSIISKLNIVFEITNPEKKKELEKSISESITNIDNFFQHTYFLLSNLQSISISNNNRTNIIDLYINNLKQDINSLKLLLTNINLSSRFTKADEHKQHFEQFILELDNFLASIESDFTSLSGYSSELFSILDTHIYTSLLSRSKNESSHKNIFDVMEQSFFMLEKEQHNFTQQTKTISDSFSKIITNLQYEDIIRQKIEHILSAQDEAKKELEIIKNIKKETLEKENNEKILRSIFVVNKIIELQTAQLLTINKEYQKAIRHIVEKFQLLDNTTYSLSGLGENLINNNAQRGTFYQSLLNSIKLDLSAFDMIPECFIIIEKIIGLTNNQISTLKIISEKLNSFLISFFTNINKICEHQSQETIKGIDFIATNIVHNSEAILRIGGELEENIKKNDFAKKQNTSLKTIEKDYSKLSKQAFDFIGGLKLKDETLVTNVEESKAKYTATSKEINQLLKKVSFYDCFEKTTIEIASKFTDLSNFIATYLLKYKTQTIDPEALDKLKELYTMDSERKIHAEVFNEDAPHTATDSASTDIELF